jgi:hypothetical protein
VFNQKHMLFVFPPTQKPTRAEYIVLAWFFSIVFVILGIVAVVMGIRAPAEKHLLAHALERRGLVFIAFGFGIHFCFWLFRRIID